MQVETALDWPEEDRKGDGPPFASKSRRLSYVHLPFFLKLYAKLKWFPINALNLFENKCYLKILTSDSNNFYLNNEISERVNTFKIEIKLVDLK